MSNDVTENKNWLQRNVKWFIPLVVLALLLMSSLFSTVSDAKVGDFAHVLYDDALYQNALKLSQQNDATTKLLGILEPIDKLAIIESDVNYSGNNAVNLSVRIKGTKAKGRMDVAAIKANNTWHYTTIKIRVKNPEQEIVVVQD